jgi:hypothetical protein
MATRSEINEMITSRAELIKFSRSLDPNSPGYDDIRARVLFVKGNPNKTMELIKDAYNAGAIQEKETTKYKEWMSEWEARDGTAE